MRAVFCSPDAAAGDLDQAAYRVRLWGRPEQELSAWQLDEWDVFNAAEVFEVVEWAESQGASTYEIAVAWPTYSQDRDGNQVRRMCYTRVAGDSGEDEPTQRVVTFDPAR